MPVMISFSVLTTYMIIAVVFCLIKSFQTQQTGGVYAQLVISMASTYGVYLASSLLALDPWHMITCMLQYMLCSPIWINVLNIYAFSNLHDLSWGTKEDRQEEDLGAAAPNKDGTVEVELPSEQADIGTCIFLLDNCARAPMRAGVFLTGFPRSVPTDAGYDDALHNLRTRPKLLPRAKTQAEKDKMKVRDFYLLGDGNSPGRTAPNQLLQTRALFLSMITTQA